MKLLFITAFLLGTASPFSVKNSKKNPLPQQQPPATVDRRSILRNAGAAGVAGATFFTTVGDSSSGGTPSAILPSVSRAHAIVYPAAKGGYKLGSPDSVVGREIRSFNELIYNFKNTALDGGLDATKLNEPSVPFIEFGKCSTTSIQHCMDVLTAISHYEQVYYFSSAAACWWWS
jgi:hypothetical protein